MFKKLRWKIQEWIIDTICSWVAIGGHCGICGHWVEDCLVPIYWRVTICNSCGGEEQSE